MAVTKKALLFFFLNTFEIIYSKAFGALQEAMGRIEILENRLNNAGIASI